LLIGLKMKQGTRILSAVIILLTFGIGLILYGATLPTEIALDSGILTDVTWGATNILITIGGIPLVFGFTFFLIWLLRYSKKWEF
jgi:hypothetical protein